MLPSFVPGIAGICRPLRVTNHLLVVGSSGHAVRRAKKGRRRPVQAGGEARAVLSLELAQARLVIADNSMSLASLLRHDQRFRLVYEDKVASVFVAVR